MNIACICIRAFGSDEKNIKEVNCARRATYLSIEKVSSCFAKLRAFLAAKFRRSATFISEREDIWSRRRADNNQWLLSRRTVVVALRVLMGVAALPNVEQKAMGSARVFFFWRVKDGIVVQDDRNRKMGAPGIVGEMVKRIARRNRKWPHGGRGCYLARRQSSDQCVGWVWLH